MNTKAKLVLEVGKQTFHSEEILSLLHQYQLLSLLQQELIIEQVISTFTCTPEEESVMIQEFFADNQIIAAEARQSWLEKRGITLEELITSLKRKYKIEKFKEQTWSKSIQSYFFKHKFQLDRVSFAIIGHQDLGLIRELYFRLQEKEQSFAELAPQYAQGEESQTGGMIGPVELGKLHPQLAQLLKSSRQGELRIARIGKNYVVTQLKTLIAAKFDQPMRKRLLQEQFDRWLQHQLVQL